MLQIFFLTTVTITLSILSQPTAYAWEQHALPTSSSQSSTPHYGGNKSPFVLSESHIKAIAANTTGMQVWDSVNDGVDWTSTPLITNTQMSINQAYLASDTLALGWGYETIPTLFHFSTNSGHWSAETHAWPLASWHIMHVSTSMIGNIVILATVPSTNKLVEGELFIIYGNHNGWSTPILISKPNSQVGDASMVNHASGLQSIVWSQRQNNTWEVMVRSSTDGQSWHSSMTVMQNIAAPFFQESAVQIAADALNHDEIALAFTGWGNQQHSQVWSKSFDAITGLTTQNIALLPDAGDMAIQPSLVTLSDNVWAVAWQQTIGIDVEIFIAQHNVDGTWTDAVNISVDPHHMDRDPHIAKGSSHTLNIAFTRRLQADIEEVYMFAEGDINDASQDSDGDGIADTQEKGFDLNNDGIDDAQSARVATWSTREGRYALVLQDNGELRQVQAPSFGSTNIEAPQIYQVYGSLFSFQIHALHTGETTQVHLITPHILDESTTWLKLNPSAQWADSEKGSVYRDIKQTGLMIQLTDGGAGDEDGISNGIIIDPAILATPKTNMYVTNSILSSASASIEPSDRAKGCILTSHNNKPWFYLIFLILTVAILIAKRTNKLAH